MKKTTKKIGSGCGSVIQARCVCPIPGKSLPATTRAEATASVRRGHVGNLAPLREVLKTIAYFCKGRGKPSRDKTVGARRDIFTGVRQEHPLLRSECGSDVAWRICPSAVDGARSFRYTIKATKSRPGQSLALATLFKPSLATRSKILRPHMIATKAMCRAYDVRERVFSEGRVNFYFPSRWSKTAAVRRNGQSTSLRSVEGRRFAGMPT